MAVLLALVVLAGCRASGRERQGQRERKPPPVPVTVATTVKRDLPIQARAIGHVEPEARVTVRPQISGVLGQVHFREGQELRKGQLLFSLDRRPFELALREAQANLARDTARHNQSAGQARRYAALLKEGVVSREQAEQLRAEATSQASVLQADRTAVEQARLQLSYSSIHAPISGRTGNLLVHPGNLVKANDDELVVIHQLSPIAVSFAVPEQRLAEIRQHMKAGLLPVEATPRGGRGAPARGRVAFVDNAVDPATGNIRVKATFSNPDHSLWPGQFVDAVVTLGRRKGAVVVPAAAVQAGQQGPYVYVIKRGNTAELREVTLAGETGGGETAVVTRGLAGGETVVTDGQLRLTPGAQVTIKQGGPQQL